MGRRWMPRSPLQLWPVTLLVAGLILAVPVAVNAQATVATSPRFMHAAVLLDDGRVLVMGGMTTYGSGEPPLAIAELHDPTSGSWVPTGSMTTGRILPTATHLDDGSVLVVGGAGDGEGALSSAERYDPRTGTFTPTGTLSTARARHTATLLDDGRVLVAGGGDSANDALPLASAEIYDPTTAAFAPTGSMTTPRGFHTATRLADGRVLITGGFAGPSMSEPLASAEIYDPSTGGFTPTGSMAVPRTLATATLLADGGVLVVRGANPEATDAAAERYDPSTGAFAAVGRTVAPGGFQTATLLDDGRVLVVGGFGGDPEEPPAPLASAELYDLATSTFTRTGSPLVPHMLHTATLLTDGRVLVVGGGLVRGDGGVDRPVASVERYDQTSGLFEVPRSGADPSPSSSPGTREGSLGPVGVGGRVDVPESGFAVTFPDGWLWAVATSADLERLGESLVAIDPTRGPLLSASLDAWSSAGDVPDLWGIAPVPPGTSVAESCWVDAASPSGESISQRMDANEAAWSTVTGTTVTGAFPVDLPAGIAGRLDRAGPWSFPTGEAMVEGSMYFLAGASHDYTMNCLSIDAPADHWLSIAETLVVLPDRGRVAP